MLRTLDLRAFATGAIIDNAYETGPTFVADPVKGLAPTRDSAALADQMPLPVTTAFAKLPPREPAVLDVVAPCLAAGTRIATAKGERRVEDLQVGDQVITRDNGIQKIRWLGHRRMSGAELKGVAHLKPVLIRQGALGNQIPERDILVSPNHRILIANNRTSLYFEQREVLVAAKYLTGLNGVEIVDVPGITYIHIMFDHHEVVLSDGAWTESFQPCGMSLIGLGEAHRREVLELFPELANAGGQQAYVSARRSLKMHEARLLTESRDYSPKITSGFL